MQLIQLPLDSIYYTFSFLDIKDLFNIRLVSKYLNRVICQNPIWRIIVPHLVDWSEEEINTTIDSDTTGYALYTLTMELLANNENEKNAIILKTPRSFPRENIRDCMKSVIPHPGHITTEALEIVEEATTEFILFCYGELKELAFKESRKTPKKCHTIEAFKKLDLERYTTLNTFLEKYQEAKKNDFIRVTRPTKIKKKDKRKHPTNERNDEPD